jgi:hypothetical protein
VNLTRQIAQRATKATRVSVLEELEAIKQNRAPQDSAYAVLLKHLRCTVVGRWPSVSRSTHATSAGFRWAGGTFGLTRKTFSGSYLDFNSWSR